MWGVPPMVLSMLQASPMCTISSNTTLWISEKAFGVGPLTGVWSFIDHNPHRSPWAMPSRSGTRVSAMDVTLLADTMPTAKWRSTR
jgi:hypothetical protein